MIALLLVSLLVIAVSALASCVEAAIFTVPYIRVRAMAKARKPGSKALLKVKEDMTRAIGTVVIVNNLSNILGSGVVGVIAHDVFGSFAIGVFFFVFTLAVIVIAELLPKTLGEAHADAIAPLAAPLMLVLINVFYPVLWLVNRVVQLLRLRPPEKDRVDEEEIKMMALMGLESGAVEHDESRIIHQVFQLNDITADDMMTAMPNIETLPAFAKLGELREQLLQVRHSRLPAVGSAPDIVLGVVLLRDLLAAMAKDRFEDTVADYAQEPNFVPAALAADDLLPIFQKKEQHLAVVVDEMKHMVGVVTLEDVIEELVGEITDEKDVRPETIKRVSKSEIIVDEATDIAKINHFFNTAIDYDGTVGDLVEEKFGRRAKAGEEVRDKNLAFRVVTMSRTRPKTISIRKDG